jgi:phosphoribosylglycinamide formyltransferase-1
MIKDLSPVRIAIFASGKGSNAREIIHFFQNGRHRVDGRKIEIALIVCNKAGAGVLNVAEESGIPWMLLEKEKFYNGTQYLEELSKRDISFIVLAGFLWKIPPGLIAAFPDRILNIHPALLPAFGGKGMYGNAVHEAVIASGAKQSGITIHYVDEQYDHGRIFFQASVHLSPEETPESLAEKIHTLEHQHFPAQIFRWVECKLSLNP